MSITPNQFFGICPNAKPARGSYVSLYVVVPFYGGPEEGGWWGEDVGLVAYEWFDTEEAARAAYEKIRASCDERNAEERRKFHEQCRAECEWLERHGLDDSALPEVDGEIHYFVQLEDRPGESGKRGDRHYS